MEIDPVLKPKDTITYTESLDALKRPDVLQSLMQQVDPTMQVRENMDIVEQLHAICSLIMPEDLVNGRKHAYSFTNVGGKEETVDIYEGHRLGALAVVASHIIDDLFDDPFVIEEGESSATDLNEFRKPKRTYRNDVADSMGKLTGEDGRFADDKVDEVFDEVMGRICDRNFQTQIGYDENRRPKMRNINISRGLIGHLLGGINEAEEQSKEERERLFKLGVLQMIRGGEINSYVPLMQIENRLTAKQMTAKFRQLFAQHLSQIAYWHRPGNAMYDFLHNNWQSKPSTGQIRTRSNELGWKAGPAVEPFVTNASADLLMFLPFGDLPVNRKQTELLDYLYGKYVYLNNQGEEANKYWVSFFTAKEQAIDKPFTPKQVKLFQKDDLPFLDEWRAFDIAIAQTLCAQACVDEPPARLTLQLMKRLTPIHQMFGDPTKVHNFGKFSKKYWTNLNSIGTGNDNLADEENSNRWNDAFIPSVLLVNIFLNNTRQL